MSVASTPSLQSAPEFGGDFAAPWGALNTVRLVAVGSLLVVLAYWSIRRFLGNGTDPNLQATVETDQGTHSWLVSGTMAVGLVGFVTVMLTAPELLSGSLPGRIALFVVAGAVLVSFIAETEERA
jgi:hypothetical protein